LEGVVFGWLRGKQHPRLGSSQVNTDTELPFKSNLAAFQYSCKYMQSELKTGLALPALVSDCSNEYGTKVSVSVDAKGNQTAVLLVCSRDNGFRVISSTVGPKGPLLKPGDLVVWQPMQFNPQLAGMSDDTRTGWVGLILGTLKPILKIETGWVGDQQFRS
jgi:hypothetical protein